MNDSFTHLQRTLRAIERGERLEAIDSLLVRDVLQLPRSPPVNSSPQNELQGSEAYKILLQLRKQRQKAIGGPSAKPSVSPDTQLAKKNPEKHKRSKRDWSPVKRDEDRQQHEREEHERFQIEAREATLVRQEMETMLAATQKELVASQQAVTQATEEMAALLTSSQAVLSSTFLFEKNLTAFCQERSLEVIQRVLQRFHHRFYALYYQKWVTSTRYLRFIAQTQAATTIARVVRGHHARQLRQTFQSEAVKLEKQAHQVIELRVTYRRQQAVRIQRNWRRYQWRQHENARIRRKQAVIYLQHQWRDRKLRRNALIATLLNIRAIRASIRIQKVGRGYVIRRRLARQQREAHRQAIAMDVLTRNTSRTAMIHWQLERHGAAFAITSVLYPMCIRQRFRRLAKDLKRQKSARVIALAVLRWHKRQSRGRSTPISMADRLRILLGYEHARIDHAAVQIQKTIRRWWYQQQYETQQTRRKKIAKRQRLADKQLRMNQKHTGGNRATEAIAGLAEVLKQTRKKNQAIADGPAQAATKIQRHYLRHRHHVHFCLDQWRQRAVDVEVRVQRRRRAAITIQKHIRGHLARQFVHQRRANDMICQHILRWKWRRATRRLEAARRILRWLKHKQTQRLAKLWKLEKARQVAMATRLQRWLRRGYFYRKRTHRLLAYHRKREEARIMAGQSLVITMQHLTDAVLLASTQGIEDNLINHLKSQTTTPLSKPPVRARFPILPLVFLVVSGLKDPALWTSMEIKDLVVTEIDRSKIIALFRAANKHASPRRQHKPLETFAMTDVDLAMATAAGASKRALTFPEFIETLQRLADLKLTHVTLWWSQYDGATARFLALLWQFVFPIAEIQPLVQELSAYVTHVVHAHARVIQRLFLKQRNIARGLLLKLQRQQERAIETKRRAIIKVQACVRRRLARTVFRTQIQAHYDKYVDADWGLPYWMNRKTGFSTWQKPWVLGDLDVDTETVPFPPADQCLTIPCQGISGCTTCSDIYCYACDEFFCQECEPTFHKQNDGDHEMETLRKCGLCKFQVASRHCTGCAEATKKRGSPPKPLDQDDDTGALYCDVCFVFTHKRGSLQVHPSIPLVAMCEECYDEDALLDIPTAPRTPPPVPRAVQWECKTDTKRICGVCASQRHPTEACGELTRLQLITNRMKERSERLKLEQEARERSDTELIRQRELLVKQERATKVLQRFWRNSASLFRARRIARSLREAKDATWKQHQLDAAVQKTLKYQLKHVFGYATALVSDSIVQQKLREMNAYQRRQLEHRARAFGLLVGEYMQLGVPLPGIVRVSVGDKYMVSSDDLRGWIRNRQTLRLKKLPSQAKRDRARRLRYRPDEPPLEDKAWLHELEQRMRNPKDTLLVDIDATQRITEHNIPIATAFTSATDEKKTDEEHQIEEYAVFLVEFSMDPTRIVWVSHSLAERFTVWTKQKLREYRERRKLQKDTKDQTDKAVQPMQSTSGEGSDLAKEGNEDPMDPQVPPTYETQPAEATGWGEYYNSGYTNDYSLYYGQNTWTAASNSWYNNYTTSGASSWYPNYNSIPSTGMIPSYDYNNVYASGASTDYSKVNAYASPQTIPTYNYYDSSPVTATYSTSDPGTSLVNSSNYFYADDGNAAAWQAYYAAHPEMTSNYDAYNTTALYPIQDPWVTSSVDSNADDNSALTNSLYPWEEVYDPTTQQTYYYNHETQATSWTSPFAT